MQYIHVFRKRKGKGKTQQKGFLKAFKDKRCKSVVKGVPKSFIKHLCITHKKNKYLRSERN